MHVCDGIHQFLHVSLILHLLLHGVDLMSSNTGIYCEDTGIYCEVYTGIISSTFRSLGGSQRTLDLSPFLVLIPLYTS